MKIYKQIKTGLIEVPGINQRILEEFRRHRDDTDTRKTHFFHGRYENIYIPLVSVPSLQPVLDTLKNLAAEQLGIAKAKLKTGFWFNEMAPGQSTTLHAHDDFDEVLSAAYYVVVPKNSGNIIFHEGQEKREIEAQEGMYIAFPPEIKHEVTENRSVQVRLSIGINIGAETDE